ncbi:oxidoreductase [Nocardioides marmorisolisilvae]|uniref:Probable oxidoreductase n=1 Tax=Nocardioides marmorisolisilvae TaxID=1542737 RepID=A0A3N0E0G5_9ACTN|nr:oxidoreductase [Nocardioides marmorisolisilvae]RNL81347.1 SDR family NAD(P)-dependent oxidoreductase [Nocardioides marmorisolisilvae]
MTYTRTPQQPIGTGFGLHTTAAEVLEGIDLSGTRALVTGGYSGIGIEMVRALTGAGATVLAPARRPEQAREALAGIPGVIHGELDLADQASVAAYADEVLRGGQHLDIVIDSAGIMACPEQHVGPGWELQFATNHLGHFALVNRLWPLITGGSRVVSISSGGHQFSGIRWEDPWFADGYDKWLAYGQSKSANVLFAVELDRRGADHDVRAFSLHPGAILTPLGRHLESEDVEKLLSYGSDGKPLMPEFKSPEAGAATAVLAATSPLLDGLGGVYLEDCEITPVANPEGRVTGQALGVMPHAIDPDEARRLWAWSADLTGLDAFS